MLLTHEDVVVTVALERGPALQETLKRARDTLTSIQREREGEMPTPRTLAARGRWA